jgi:hypothetical protein
VALFRWVHEVDLHSTRYKNILTSFMLECGEYLVSLQNWWPDNSHAYFYIAPVLSAMFRNVLFSLYAPVALFRWVHEVDLHSTRYKNILTSFVLECGEYLVSLQNWWPDNSDAYFYIAPVLSAMFRNVLVSIYVLLRL